MTARYQQQQKMKKFNTEIRNILGDSVLRELNTSHSKFVKRLNNLYAQLEAKEQEDSPYLLPDSQKIQNKE